MKEPMTPGEIILFYKPLIPGYVKTRLAASVGHDAALHIYRAMLRDTESNLTGHSGSLVPYVSTDRAAGGELYWTDSMIQYGADLGERMANAFEERFNTGVSAAVLIGSDIPRIDTALINRYFHRLKTNDMVIGPSDDGGYYLIGFTSDGFRKSVFEGIPWSTDRVLELTWRKAAEAGLRAWVGPPLTDVDTVEDLQRVIENFKRSGKIDHLLAAWNRVTAEIGNTAGVAISLGETG